MKVIISYKGSYFESLESNKINFTLQLNNAKQFDIDDKILEYNEVISISDLQKNNEELYFYYMYLKNLHYKVEILFLEDLLKGEL